MDKWQTQQAFWSSFDIPAYDEQTRIYAETQTEYRYLTYQGISDDVFKESTTSVNVFDRSTSWAWISQKVSEIEQTLKDGGVLVAYDGGMLWLKIPTATPFAQRVDAGTDDTLIKRIYLTVEIEYL